MKQALEHIPLREASPRTVRAPASAHPLLHLQRTAGNRAIATLLTTKHPAAPPAQRSAEGARAAVAIQRTAQPALGEAIDEFRKGFLA